MPLLWLGSAFIIGIRLAAFNLMPRWAWLVWLASGAACALLEFFRISRERHPLASRALFRVSFGLLAAACALGGLRFLDAQPHLTPRDLAWHQPKETAVVTGMVSGYPQRSSSATIAVISAESILIADEEKPVSGKLELRLPAGFRLRYGDRMRLSGRLQATIKEGRPAYTSALAREGILSRMPYPQIETIGWGYGSHLIAGMHRLRQCAQTLIYNQMPFPESSLLEGILLGIEWTIPNFLKQAYRGAGTIHIIAISGFNIALISNLIIRLFRRIFPLSWAGWLAVGAITYYTLLVGAEPAVVRAAIMGSLAIPAHYFGRRVLGLHALVVAAVIMLIFNPFLLWDISFQLSFLATLGLMVLVDPLTVWLKTEMGKFLPERSVDLAMPAILLVTTTLCAQFAVSPVLLMLDARLPVFSLAANLIVLPVQPLVMALGGLAVLSGFFLPPLGALFGRLVWPLIVLSNRVALMAGFNPRGMLLLPDSTHIISGLLVSATLLFASVRQLRALTKPSDRD